MTTSPDLAAAETQHAAAARAHAAARTALAAARAKLAEAQKLAADLLARAGAGEPIPPGDLVKAQTGTREPEAAVALALAAERAAASRLAAAEEAMRVARKDATVTAERDRRAHRVELAAKIDHAAAELQALVDGLNATAAAYEPRYILHLGRTPLRLAGHDELDVRATHRSLKALETGLAGRPIAA